MLRLSEKQIVAAKKLFTPPGLLCKDEASFVRTPEDGNGLQAGQVLLRAKTVQTSGWPQHIGGAVALLGRSGETMVCGRACVLHTGVGRYRSGRFAIPCGGPGSGRVAKGWGVSATPNGTIVLVLFATSSRGASMLPSEAQCINGCVRGTGRHCEEAGGDRQGSPRRERATGHHHLYRGCHAFVVLRDRLVVEHSSSSWLETRPGPCSTYSSRNVCDPKSKA